MILKDVDVFTPRTAMERAGLDAEQQLAFYLKRRYEDARDVLVLNGIRIERGDGDAVQMDHLVIHRGGFVVVESKSVSTRLKVNVHGEWSRYFDGRWSGMPSPLHQVDRQVDAFRRVVQQHAKVVLDKVSGKFREADSISYRRLVAFSDNGIVDRPHGFDMSDVVKADMVVKRLEQVMAEQVKGAKSAGGLLSALFGGGSKGGWQLLTEGDMTRLGDLLLSLHRPLRSEARGPQAVAATAVAPVVEGRPVEAAASIVEAAPGVVSDTVTACAPLPEKRCSKCSSTDVVITSGRYGYYLKCGACGGNTGLTAFCSACGEKRKLTKEGAVYYAVCGKTGEKVVHHQD